MGKKAKFTEAEIKLMKDMDAISAQAEANPKIRNMRVPESLWNELQRDVIEYNEAKRAKEKEQRSQELIKLGLVYERKRKYRKYYVLAATFVLALAVGITSFGDAEKIFNRINTIIAGREQEVIDSEGMIPNAYVNEDEAFEAVEDQLGVCPVKLEYLPSDIGFIESTIYLEMQRAHLKYGTDNTINIIYTIRTNYRDGSWATDMEDEVVKAYEIQNENTIFYVKEYLVEKTVSRWFVQFEYKDVSYSLIINDILETDVEKILAELYFY